MAAPVFYMKSPRSQKQRPGAVSERARSVAIVGPTASGKTSLAIRLAQTLDGEVVSCDSRQVYRGLDIGTGKVTPEEMAGIPHHLLDIADPAETYTAADFVRDADGAITDITARGKLPIIAGGTFFYLEALLGTKAIAGVPPNEPLRTELAEKTPEELHADLVALDPAYAEVVDRHNPHRLVRAIEVATALGSVPTPRTELRYDVLTIGLDVPSDILAEKISRRLQERFAEGMLEEAKHLHATGLSFERMDALGLEYRYMARHLQGALNYDEMQTTLEQKIRQYAKRQRTWLRSMPGVQWFASTDYEGTEEAVRKFLST